MGVKGLLPCLQSITRVVSLERYRGLTVAVDAMSWLHKGVFACDVRDLARSQRGRATKAESAERKCVNYAIKKAETLRNKFGLEVVLVIDGDSLPSKKEENEQRREERKKAFEKAVAAEKAGDTRTARRFYAQSCSVSYQIRYELIKACKQSGISFLVAPYEADAQMARLAHTGMVDLVITEDSDILAYGCPRALFKVDFDTSQGQEIQLMRDLGENDSPSFKNWTHDMFVFMCIISGCDYCTGVPGIGIKLAHKIVRVHRTPSKIFNALRAAGRMPHDFEEKFWIAFRTFRHQRVFCPSKERVEPLWPIPGSNQETVWPFLGDFIASGIATRIANGVFHPAEKIDWEVALAPIHYQKDAIGSKEINQNETCVLYRSDAESVREDMLQEVTRKPQPCPRPADADEKENMFRFFSRTNKRGSEELTKSTDGKLEGDGTRPPLKEVYLDCNSDGGSTSQTHSKLTWKGCHKDVPIHFHEYTTRLVGRTFKPLSRKRIKREDTGTKSSKCVQKIWENASGINTRGPEAFSKVETDESHVNFPRKESNLDSKHPPQDFATTPKVRFDCFTFNARHQVFSDEDHENDMRDSTQSHELILDRSNPVYNSDNYNSFNGFSLPATDDREVASHSCFDSNDPPGRLSAFEECMREDHLSSLRNMDCIDSTDACDGKDFESDLFGHFQSDELKRGECENKDSLYIHQMDYMPDDVDDDIGVYQLFQDAQYEDQDQGPNYGEIGHMEDSCFYNDHSFCDGQGGSRGLFEDDLLNTFDMMQQI